MKIIVITQPRFLDGEAGRIAELLESGEVERVHIRKPDWNCIETRRLIESIPEKFHKQLTLHDHHNLAVEFKLGIHLNGRNPLPPDEFCGTTSRSCHTFDEIRSQTADYCFLSPIFDSISKAGYHSNFSTDVLRHAAGEGIIDSHVYALGGVKLHHLHLLSSIGFGGAAMLGAVWKAPSTTVFINDLIHYK